MFVDTLVECIREKLEVILELRDDFVLKPDGSPVSKGDLLVEQIVFDLAKAELPNHVLISEEQAPFADFDLEPEGKYIVLDPIDGTENFVSGLIEWGVGCSVYTQGRHQESLIFLPEIGRLLKTGSPTKRYKSRINGITSNLKKVDLGSLDTSREYRIIGCSMYNMFSVIQGSFQSFYNNNNVWDILPGINLALERGLSVTVDGKPYKGEMLPPIKKYEVKVWAE
jgi:myo-inositol-1(or 4)-monophosphatase